VSGLYFVHKHVREKALYDMIRSKTRLLKHLSKLRHKLAHVNSDIIENRIEETVKHATLKTEEVASRVDALQERLETIVNIEIKMQLAPSSSSMGSEGSLRTPERRGLKSHQQPSPPTLPLGVGKRLDDALMKGDLSIDDYVLKMSKLADDATESLSRT